MKKRNVYIFQMNTGNFKSVQTAFEKLSCDVTIGQSLDEALASEFFVLPGVGDFDSTVSQPSFSVAKKIVMTRLEAKKPCLFICLGMQLLFETSDESRLNLPGIGYFKGQVQKLQGGLSLPHLGWNEVVSNSGDDSGFETPFAYFSHTYAVEKAPAHSRFYETTYTNRFVSMLEWDRSIACQFHPEISGQWGQQLLKKWLSQVEV